MKRVILFALMAVIGAGCVVQEPRPIQATDAELINMMADYKVRVAVLRDSLSDARDSLAAYKGKYEKIINRSSRSFYLGKRAPDSGYNPSWRIAHRGTNAIRAKKIHNAEASPYLLFWVVPNGDTLSVTLHPDTKIFMNEGEGQSWMEVLYYDPYTQENEVTRWHPVRVEGM